MLVYDISLSDFSSLCIIGSRLLKRKEKDTEAGDNREEGCAKTRAEIGMIQLQDKEPLWLLRASGSWEEARKDSPLEPRSFSGCRFCWHPDFRLLASRAVREYNLCCLGHQVCYLVRAALGNKYRCIYSSLASTLLPFPCPLTFSHTGRPAVLGVGTPNWFPPQGLSLVTSSWDALLFAKWC